MASSEDIYCTVYTKDGRFELTESEWQQFYNLSYLYRTDGLEIVEYATGDKEWWENGVRHREDGPAIEYSSGGKLWVVNGKPHRVDGPAYVAPGNKTRMWYIEGKKLDTYEVEKWLEENDIDLSINEGQMALVLRFAS